MHVRPCFTLAPILLCALLCGCSSPGPMDETALVDLTYAFDANTIYWPTAERFELRQAAWGMNSQGLWYASNEISCSEHGGTHLDAPIHFAEGKRTVEAIPIEQLMGAACVIDIRSSCATNRDYLLAAADIEAHEEVHGRIPKGAVVLVHTGWGRHWPDASKYLGNSKPGDASNLHFPGISEAAAAVLVERGIDLVGIDTASLDHGPSEFFRAHRTLAKANIPGLENVAHLEQLPPRGATILAMPMKIAGGTGGPCRIVAFLPAR